MSSYGLKRQKADTIFKTFKLSSEAGVSFDL